MRTAAYTRYSSENQRAASLEDQARNIRSFCQRMGWPAPVMYSDAAISGTRDDRPGYQQMLSAASAGDFELLLVDELSRLSRDTVETGRLLQRFRFHGIRLVGVSDGTDTGREGHELETGVKAVISEHYSRELAKRTHRGLTGRALEGASAGGLPYGYQVAGAGQRAIDGAQAAIVRRIFEEFVGGRSARDIAAGLNADGVPTARGRSWCMTAIYGDIKRGIGILANPIYIGRQIWNRSKWVKHPDTKLRTRIERPASEWIVTEQPELAIVSPELWDAAQARLRAARARTVEHAARGKRSGGKPHRYVLSGLLRCESCGGALVVVDYYRYGCAAAKDRGAAVCGSRLKVARVDAERALLDLVKRDMLSEAAYKAYEREVRAALKDATPDLGGARKRLAEAERVQENLMAALRAGIITPGTKAALTAAEADVTAARHELERLQNYQPTQVLPRLRETWRRMVDQLEGAACVSETREVLRQTLGDQIVLTQKAGTLYARVPARTCEIAVVAGAGFGRYLTHALLIPIPRAAPDRR